MKRHRFDPFSFVFGVLFLVIGATFLFGGTEVGSARPGRMLPATVVVVGVTLALWAVSRAVRSRAPGDEATPAMEIGSVGADDPEPSDEVEAAVTDPNDQARGEDQPSRP